MSNTKYIKSIKEWYMDKYPQDELGVELNENTTFVGLLNVLHTQGSGDLNDTDVYRYIGVGDSLVRERLFVRLSYILNKPYEYIYQLWLS